MPRVNVYLPDDLAEAVRQLDLPVSAICQEALTTAIQAVTDYRAIAAPTVGLLTLTEKARAALRAASFSSRGRPRTARDLLVEVAAQPGVVAAALKTLRVTSSDINNLPPTGEESDGFDEATRPSSPSGHEVLHGAIRQAIAFGHHYIAPEHLLLAAGEAQHPWTSAAMTALGVDRERLRAAVVEAMTDHARSVRSSQQGESASGAGIQNELAEIRRRLDALEA